MTDSDRDNSTRDSDGAQRKEPSFAHKLHVAETLIEKMRRGDITPAEAQRSWDWFRTLKGQRV